MMKIARLRLISNNMGYGPWPEPGAEVEQRLTITAAGRVFFASYGWEGPPEQYRKLASRTLHIDPAGAEQILSAVSARFIGGQEERFVSDVGTWDLDLTDTEGETQNVHGSLCAELGEDDAVLSDLIRDTLGMVELFAFDGNPDRVERVTVDYRHFTRASAKAPDSEKIIYRDWYCVERLVVDRASSTVELVRNTAPGCIFSQRLQSKDVVDLLDDLEPDRLFGAIEGNPEDTVDNPMDTRDYTVTVDFKRRPQCIFQGSYDKKALPEDWGDFVDPLWWLLQSHGMGEILDPTIYGRTKRRAQDPVYCNVEFEPGGKRYYYIADVDKINVGDRVIVPVGKDHRPTTGRVVEVDVYSVDQVPFPLEKTKHILGKITAPEDERDV